MGAFKTLNDLKKKTEKPKDDRVKKNFVTLKDGEQVRLRFLQEVAQDGSNYTEERGVARVIPMHKNPLNFKKQGACTMDDDGQCWACEQTADNFKWKPKNHLLINVAVLEDKVWVPKVLDQTFFSSHVGETVIEVAEEFGTIMNHTFKFSRKGENMDTAYSLLPLTESKEPAELKDVELVDFTGFKAKPYAEQEAFYLDEPAPSESW